jgi:hypothetical protein
VHPGYEMTIHYFSCSGGPSAVSINKTLGHVMPNFCFLHPVGFAGHFMQSHASEAQNTDTLFSCSGGTDMDSIKSEPAHITPNMCFYIRGDLRVT